MSDFTTMFDRAVDWIRWGDIELAWDPDKLAKSQRDSIEMGRVGRALAMFSALGRPEDQAKKLFVTATNRVTRRLNALLDEAEALLLGFQNIQDILGHLKETTIGEIGDQPAQNVLGAVWVLLRDRTAAARIGARRCFGTRWSFTLRSRTSRGSSPWRCSVLGLSWKSLALNRSTQTCCTKTCPSKS